MNPILGVAKKARRVLCDENKYRWTDCDLEVWSQEALLLSSDESAAVDYVCWKATVMENPDTAKQFLKMAIMKIFFGDK